MLCWCGTRERLLVHDCRRKTSTSARLVVGVGSIPGASGTVLVRLWAILHTDTKVLHRCCYIFLLLPQLLFDLVGIFICNRLVLRALGLLKVNSKRLLLYLGSH